MTKVKKPRQRLGHRGPPTKNRPTTGVTDSPNSNSEVDLTGEDDWVMVKVQRVNILLPPLTVANDSMMLDPGPSEPQAIPPTTENDPSQAPIEIRQRVNILLPPLTVANYSAMLEPGPSELQAISTTTVNDLSQNPVEGTHSIKKRKRSKQLASNREDHEARKETLDQHAVIFDPPDTDKGTQSADPDQPGTSGDHIGRGVPNTLKSIKQSRPSHGPWCVVGESLLNKRMKIFNLERKIQKSGGLSKWLASLGLHQFIKIFEVKRFSNFELVNLTMEKLKNMGASAVGPRRKLMHAIDCVC